MILSSPILPLRIYDSLFDQQRFNTHCKNAKQLDLVYPTNELPYFQYNRVSSLTAPSALLLKNVCNDHEYDGENNVTKSFFKEIPEAAANFSNYASNSGIYSDFPPRQDLNIFGQSIEMAEITCRGLSNVTSLHGQTLGGTSAYFSFGISAAAEFHFKIIVERLIRSVGSTFTIKIWEGGVGGILQQTITSAGIYNFNFTPISNPITVEFKDWVLGDIFDISYMQCERVDIHAQAGQNTPLDETMLKVVTMADGTDIIIYCEADQAYDLGPGEYYYVIVDNGAYYFSEVFKLVTLKESEKYYRLTWHNDECDINNSVIYQPQDTCDYYNRLYLDAALFKPESETTEEGEENGQGQLTILSQGWKKNINFEIPKCPEFLTDSLSAIFMHSYIALKQPLNAYQEQTTSEFTVQRIVSDISNILNDCFQKVNLKLLLFFNYTKTGCCNVADEFDCNPCAYTAGDNTCSGFDYNLVITNPPDPDDGLYNCDGNILVHVQEDDIICVGSQFKTLANVGTEEAPAYQVLWIAPAITSVVLIGSDYYIDGRTLPFAFAEIQYNKDGAGWVTVDSIQGGDGSDPYNFTYLLDATLAAGAIDFDVRFIMKTKNCGVIATSDPWDII